MKQRMILIFSFTFLVFSTVSAWALDPTAPRSMRNSGMIYIDTPNSSDKITITNLKTKAIETIKPGKVEIVPVGNYQVQVTMKDIVHTQKVKVTATERTDVIPGFGNLKVKGPRSAIVQVFDKKQGKLIAEFPANQTHTLPRGQYDLKILFKGMEVSKPGVLVIGNATSDVRIRS